MRNIDMLKAIGDTGTLLQYLYCSPDNAIVFNNGVTNLELTMNDDGYILVKNLNFPKSPPTDFANQLTVLVMLEIIDQLKTQPPKIKNTTLKSRWDEIVFDVSAAIVQTQTIKTRTPRIPIRIHYPDSNHSWGIEFFTTDNNANASDFIREAHSRLLTPGSGWFWQTGSDTRKGYQFFEYWGQEGYQACLKAAHEIASVLNTRVIDDPKGATTV